jgi:hypothetical protein
MTLKPEKSMSKVFQAKIDAKVELLVWIREDKFGFQEVEEIIDVIGDVDDFENVRET